MTEILMYILFLPTATLSTELDKVDKQLVKESQEVVSCVIAVYVLQNMKYELIKLDFLRI
jgi:hypothetical protein